ncbi:MAG TPA: transcription antitermination factor NusB [Candidatus Bathyarchaeia archaeon]|nr:transcription antitermination factor NusB [Candidatus Bathyarchaeia archaeon]
MAISLLLFEKKEQKTQNHDVAEHENISCETFSRRDVRSLIFHLLYAAEAFDYEESLPALVDNFNRGFDLDVSLDSDIVTTAQAIISSRQHLDKTYEPFLANWRPERISIITKLILRFGTWELLNTTTDPRIIINESIELTKCFAEDDAYKFVNGILDKVAKNVRAATVT